MTIATTAIVGATIAAHENTIETMCLRRQEHLCHRIRVPGITCLGRAKNTLTQHQIRVILASEDPVVDARPTQTRPTPTRHLHAAATVTASHYLASHHVIEIVTAGIANMTATTPTTSTIPHAVIARTPGLHVMATDLKAIDPIAAAKTLTMIALVIDRAATTEIDGIGIVTVAATIGTTIYFPVRDAMGVTSAIDTARMTATAMETGAGATGGP